LLWWLPTLTLSVLKDLISDATATKQAIDEAHESIENANEVLARSTTTLGGGVSTGGMASYARTPAPAPLPNVLDDDLFGGWDSGDTGAVNAPLPALGTSSGIYTVTSSTEEVSKTPSISNSPLTALIPQQPTHPTTSTTFSYTNLEPPSTSSTTNMYNGGGYTGGGHNRDVSGNDFGEVMGSGPALQIPSPSMLAPPQQAYDSSGYSSPMGAATTYDSIPHVTSMKEVEDLKSKSKEADDVARDAEASRRQVVAQLEELRKLADDAESKARAASEKPIKKKGLLGRGAVQKKDAVRDRKSIFVVCRWCF
jgi:hypothetical protein